MRLSQFGISILVFPILVSLQVGCGDVSPVSRTPLLSATSVSPEGESSHSGTTVDNRTSDALANPCVDTSGATSTLASLREAVCLDTNSERAGSGAGVLVLDQALSAVAQAHAVDMVTRGYFNHVSPEGSTMTSRLTTAGVSYAWAGENIARGYTDPVLVMDGWMSSTGHRGNILNPKFRRIGIGYYQRTWVQVFTD